MPESLTFSIGDDANVTVRSYDDLLKWLSKERSKWAWMVPGDPRTDRLSLSSELQSTWNNLIEGVAACQAQGQPLDYAGQFLAHLTNSLILVSTTSDGANVLDIRESAGEIAASAALGFVKQRLNLQYVGKREELLGLLLTVAPDMRDPADWAERLKRERSNFRNATRSLLEKVDNEAEKRQAEALELAARAKGIAQRVFKLRRRSWKTAQRTWEKEVAFRAARIESDADASIDSITNAEASYREFMRLKAPVEYWEKKAGDHKARESDARFLLLIFFPVMVCVLAAVFFAAGWFLVTHPDSEKEKLPTAIYVVVSGGLLLLSTVSFWIGRLLTKLYLSEHHLRNDAEERATMTTTYLALTAENAAADTDRQIVLAALFRATPDGIVKEDGPGDIGLPGLLSKLLAVK